MAKRSSGGDALTELVLKVFRLNGRFLEVADGITEGSGLTAARWQVLGAVLREPLSVAAAARSMGLTRQSVQRLADVLVDEGLCTYLDNPAHRRAKLLAPTERGWAAIRRFHPIQVAWADQVSAAVGERALRAANETLDAVLAVLAAPAGQVSARTRSTPRPRSRKAAPEPTRRRRTPA
ncbi:MarR family winged helix-turn-helix transcriptional regulator [Sorangium cellulosum]|uniref:MarR family winged helix-turn-helix transcriptional regulator n=1 Tax=Sorangium cellulosum TaxID=56 RepID=UPI003D9A3071